MDERMRAHVKTECGGGMQGNRCVEALERALGRYNHTWLGLTVDNAPRKATACWLAEEEAEAALKELIDWAEELRHSITDPGEAAPDKDSSSWNCDVSAGEMDRVVHAMRRLEEARRTARPAR